MLLKMFEKRQRAYRAIGYDQERLVTAEESFRLAVPIAICPFFFSSRYG